MLGDSTQSDRLQFSKLKAVTLFCYLMNPQRSEKGQ